MRTLRLAVLTAVLALSTSPALLACAGSFMPTESPKPTNPDGTVDQPSEEYPRDRTVVLAATGGGALLLTGAAVVAIRRTGVA